VRFRSRSRPCLLDLFVAAHILLQDIRKKPVPIQDQVVTDEQGRRRFHGAFTGGYSAGYYNTAGSKEGELCLQLCLSLPRRSSYTCAALHLVPLCDVADASLLNWSHSRPVSAVAGLQRTLLSSATLPLCFFVCVSNCSPSQSICFCLVLLGCTSKKNQDGLHQRSNPRARSALRPKTSRAAQAHLQHCPGANVLPRLDRLSFKQISDRDGDSWPTFCCQTSALDRTFQPAVPSLHLLVFDLSDVTKFPLVLPTTFTTPAS
jgi:hypothetical protein